jgi:hypothetical protein
MNENSEHLNFDLAFLDPSPIESSAHRLNESKYKINWRNIVIISGALLLFGAFVFTQGDKPTSSGLEGGPEQASTGNSPNPGWGPAVEQGSAASSEITTGTYRCSKYDHQQAQRLSPVENEAQLDTSRRDLDSRQSKLNALKSEIENSGVSNDSSQDDIDRFNLRVDEYNAQLQRYNSDQSEFDTQLSRFNAEVDAYNNFLATHCTPRN